MIVSVGVSVAIIFLAHAAGVLLAKREAVLHPGDTAILTAIFAGVVATIIGLSFVRELYLVDERAGDGCADGPDMGCGRCLRDLQPHGLWRGGAGLETQALRIRRNGRRRKTVRAQSSARNQACTQARKEDRANMSRESSTGSCCSTGWPLAPPNGLRFQSSRHGSQPRAEKDFIEKCYALYVRENTRSQAAWAGRRARLSQPVESGPIPTFNRLPEVKDPDVEFGPFEEQVRNELQPLDATPESLESITGTPERGTASAVNGNGTVVVTLRLPHHAS